MNVLVCPVERDDDVVLVRAPAPGIWEHGPWTDELVGAGAAIGTLSILGRRSELRLPATASGLVVSTARTDNTRNVAVAFGDVLLRLDSKATLSSSIQDEQGPEASSTELQMCSPSSGRFWIRPSPSEAPFVAVGQVVTTGDPIGLLEVMKTFTRISYGGQGLPDRARVARVAPADGDDVEAGTVLLELERDS